jgi:7-keto-8-aminopelargonate synthetase-like enzyme
VGADVLGSAHIVPVVCGERTMAVAQALLDAGIHAPGIRFPTVPRGRERIRLAVSSQHTTEQIDRCIAAVERARRG